MNSNFFKNLFSRFFFYVMIASLGFSLIVCSKNSGSEKKGGDEYGSQTPEKTGEEKGGLVRIDPEVKRANFQYELVVYKSPTCGCCDAWIDAMEDQGYSITVHNSDEQLWRLKKSLNIDPTLQSCHTTTVEGYVLEGHIHPDSVTRLLKEKSKIRGLFLPGMVPNSVGMEQPGTKPIRYAILALDYDNKKTIYDVYK